MAAVILFLVPLFHGLVFSGLIFWFKKSKNPNPIASKKLALLFATAGALANLILCIMLIELLSGLSLIAGQSEASLVENLPAMLLTQPVFILVVYGIGHAVLSASKD